MSEDLREILRRVERGELSAQEGAALLGGSQTAPPLTDAPPPPAGQAVEDDLKERLASWKRWWMIPLWVGMGIFAIGAALIALGDIYQWKFWFVCGFFPLLLGLTAMLAAWWSQRAHWVHLRIREHNGRRVNLSFPIPLRITRWAFQLFGHRIPGLGEQQAVLDSLGPLLKEMEKNHEPIAVEVNEPDGGEVRVYIT
jgi:hypothetical protein